MAFPGETIKAWVEFLVDDVNVLEAVESAHMTLSHGITPSVCTLEIQPQEDFVGKAGTLRLVQSDARAIEFPDCRVDHQQIHEGRDGNTWSVALQDRRWRWQYAFVSGTYNVRLDDGSIDPATLKTPQELAKLLLDDMEEDDYEVGDLPNEARPYVEWDETNTARALQQLAESLGCRVVYTLDDTVALRRLGVGAELPDEDVELDSLTINPPERPGTLTVLGARTRWQVDFRLEAVGVDVDGRVKPIGELSYKPTGGWGTIDDFYAQVTTANNARYYAQQTVYKLYRVTLTTRSSLEAPLRLPGYPKDVNHLWQILPLEDVQVLAAPAADGTLQPLPAYVLGTFADDSTGYQNLNSDATRLYTGSFKVLRQQGMVQFDSRVYQKVIISSLFGDDQDTLAPATLYLRTAVGVKDEVTRAPARYKRSRTDDEWAAVGERILRHDEIVLSYYTLYTGPIGISNTTDNKKTADQEADYYLDAAERDYQQKLPEEITYMGLKPINPDGAIQQVTWSLGPQGFTTKACRNDEFSNIVPPYRERRMLGQLNEAARKEEADRQFGQWVNNFKRKWLS